MCVRQCTVDAHCYSLGFTVMSDRSTYSAKLLYDQAAYSLFYIIKSKQ